MIDYDYAGTFWGGTPGSGKQIQHYINYSANDVWVDIEGATVDKFYEFVPEYANYAPCAWISCSA